MVVGHFECKFSLDRLSSFNPRFWFSCVSTLCKLAVSVAFIVYSGACARSLFVRVDLDRSFLKLYLRNVINKYVGLEGAKVDLN